MLSLTIDDSIKLLYAHKIAQAYIDALNLPNIDIWFFDDEEMDDLNGYCCASDPTWIAIHKDLDIDDMSITIGHELAHIAVFRDNPTAPDHGTAWKAVMRFIGLKPSIYL